MTHLFSPIRRQEKAFAELQIKRNETRRKVLDPYLPKQGRGAELGVFKGHFSPVLLDFTEAEVLHLVDPWYKLSGEWSWAKGEKSTVTALQKILGDLRTEIEEGRIVVHVEDDREWLERQGDGSLDWVYLDSSHAYEHTVEELELLRTKVTSGGIVAGDDWFADETHPHHGVCKAVTETVDRGEYELLDSATLAGQWILRVAE